MKVKEAKSVIDMASIFIILQKKTMFLTILISILLQIPQYEFESTSTYHPPTSHYSPSKPKKVSGLDGWTFWLLWGRNNGVPSSASNSDLLAYYDYVQAGGNLPYQQWYDQRYSVPIGDGMLLLCLFAFIYIFMKQLIKYEYNFQT